MLSKRVKCESCKHFQIVDGPPFVVCHAFPNGIPTDIFGQFVDHEKESYPGDHGIRYAPRIEIPPQ